MKILPIAAILLGIYVFFRKRKTQPADDIYDLIYKIVGVASVSFGIFMLVYQNYLRAHSINNGYYNQLFFIKSTVGNILIGFAAIWALIDTKLQKRMNLKKANPNQSSDPT